MLPGVGSEGATRALVRKGEFVYENEAAGCSLTPGYSRGVSRILDNAGKS